MIPVLFNAAETAFTSNGLGRLLDARKCLVTEERNGGYELVLEYPTSGPLFDKLIPGNYILATHDDSGDEQPFEIYETSAPLDGWTTVYAWHISYKLNRIVVEPFIASGISAALSGLATNSMNTNPFTFWTNKTTAGTFAPSKPSTVRSLLGGTSGSILDIFGGGEYEFDKFDVKLYTARGSNSGVTIRYGKNLKTLKYELDASNVYNAVVPFWQNNEQTVYLDHIVTRTGQTAKDVVPLDLSKDFKEAPTTAQLEARAQAYIDGSTSYILKDNITLDFVQLWQTEEYKLYQAVERVKLCDTVQIVYDRFGINATAKVIKTTYNTLLDRYQAMEFGEPRTTLAQQIRQDVTDSVLQDVPNVIRRTIIETEGVYPSGWNGSTKIENGTYESHATTTGFHTDGQMNAEGFEFVSVDEGDSSYEKLSAFVDAPDGITQVRLENSNGDATTLQATGINTTGGLTVGGAANVSGSVSAGSLSTSGAATAGSLNVNGAVNLNGNGCTQLLTGVQGSNTISGAYNRYSGYIVRGVPGSSGYATCYIPRSAITTSDTTWLLSNQDYYITFKIRRSGSNIIFGNTSSNNGTKSVDIYGIS